MKQKFVFAILIVFLSTQLNLTKAVAVENGIDAINDPNAVMIDGGYSGFLYAPRIVLTVAHGLDYGQKRETVRSIGLPGKVGYLGQIPSENYVTTQKIFWAPNYQSRTQNNWARIDDFAVMVLERPIEFKNAIKIATEEDIKRFRDNRTPVNLVGYGYQLDRTKTGDQSVFKITPKKLTSRIINDDESNLIKRGLPPGVIFTSDINLEQKEGQANICDGDSGAGWFVEESGIRLYLGAQSSGWGGPNCGKDGFWDRNGALVGISSAYRFIDLIEQAEKYVADNPYVEPKSNNAGFNNKTTITCVKGKSSKKVTGLTPKCPKGFKKK